MKLIRLLLAAALLVGATVGLVEFAGAAGAAPVTKSKTVTRSFVGVDGKATTVEKRSVSLTVDTTTNLRSLQLIHVSWSGAHPTGGLVADRNSDLAQNEEYPMALFECRGTDSAAHPITPDTCWTQYADERFDYGYGYRAWQADSAATTAQRADIVNSPAARTLPSSCKQILAGTRSQRWVPFRAADGTDYPGGPFGCAGLAPEASPANLTSNTALPSNETFGVTDAKGNGQADFDIFTNQDHTSLGCSTKVACSLVAIPIVGLSCDPFGTKLPANKKPSLTDIADATRLCQANGKYEPGQLLPVQNTGTPAVDGQYWWSPSNWANRISVPLTFAPADDACSASNADNDEVDVYGSELMSQATIQWSPHFCLNKSLFTLKHIQIPEPQARSLLSTGGAEAAYTSDAPSPAYPKATVNAPVATTGFGIAADVDDADGQPVPVRLNARLLAKLLTESYPSENFVKTAYEDPKSKSQALRGNPLNITYDPEFKALNPTVPQSGADAAATLFLLNSQSDVVRALTAYIDADPEARAWLDGTADPWGMRVNPNYLKIDLPVNVWPLLDTFEPTDEYQPGRIDCLQGRNAVPWLPLVAAPTAKLFTLAQNMQFALSQSQTTCVLPSPTPGDITGAKMVANGRQAAGKRMMFGLVSLGDAARNGLDLAQLQTNRTTTGNDQFTSAAGRNFAAANTAGLRAAAALLKPDTATGTFSFPYSTLSSPQGSTAYPGFMVVYAAIPTTGLTNGDGPRYGKLLAFAADPGQVAGSGAGRLPAGFLPMTAGNGLADLAEYTRVAAAYVTLQRGGVPSITNPVAPKVPAATKPTTPRSSSPTSSAPTPAPVQQPPAGGSGPIGGGGTTGSGGFGNTGGTNPGGSSPSSGGGKSSSPAPSSSPSASSLPDAGLAAARTPGLGAGFGGLVLPVLALIALIALLVAIGVRIFGRPRHR